MSTSSLKRSSQDGQQTPQKKPKRDYSEMVTIHCGPSKTAFLAHKDLLCATSDYFKAACSNKWVEGKQGVVALPDVTPTKFQQYLHWTYTKDFELPHQRAKAEDGSWTDCCCYGWRGMSNLWAIADYLGNRQLRNACIDLVYGKMQTHRTWGIRSSSIKEIFECTRSAGSLQRLITDYVLVCVGVYGENKDIDQQVEDLPEYVVKTMAKRYCESKQQWVKPCLGALCSYHEHEEGEKRCDE